MQEKTDAKAQRPNAQDVKDALKTVISYFDDPDREGLVETPERAFKALTELLSAEEPDIKLFDKRGYDDIVSKKGIQFYSTCEHHLLPFFGSVDIAYIPRDKIIGLSKLDRIVNFCSKKLTTQEHLTREIAEYILSKTDAKGVAIRINARHLCVESRGAKSQGSTETVFFTGLFHQYPEMREEFLLNQKI